MMKMHNSLLNLLNILAVIIIALCFYSCKLNENAFTDPDENINEIPISVAKWFDDHPGAISLMSDDGVPHSNFNPEVQQLILRYHLELDYELITDQLNSDSVKLNYINNFMIPNGFKLFGHGHKHDDHDKYTYDDALKSFKTCYDIMKSNGLKPVAYAYPGGNGYLFRTRRALKESGFLCGRRFEQLDAADPYIMPDSIYEPRDWFGLPCLVMQSINFDGCVAAINNTEELIPYLNNTIQKRAWLLLTYHSIGLKEGYGFYELSDFEEDLIAIQSFDFWCASINDITLYCYERNNAKVKAYLTKNKEEIIENLTIKLSDGYPNDYYNQPLTVKFEIPENWVNRKLSLIKDNKKIESYQFSSRKVNISIIPDESEYILELQ